MEQDFNNHEEIILSTKKKPFNRQCDGRSFKESFNIEDCDTSESLGPSLELFRSMNNANCKELKRQINNLSL